jgi:hypothetical protein
LGHLVSPSAPALPWSSGAIVRTSRSRRAKKLMQRRRRTGVGHPIVLCI